MWELTADAAEYELSARRPLTDIAFFSPDGRQFATAAVDGTVSLWNIAASQVVRTFSTGGHDAVRALAFSPDGRLLATAGEDRTARLWSVAEGTPLSTVGGHDDAVAGVALSEPGRNPARHRGRRRHRPPVDRPPRPPARLRRQPTPSSRPGAPVGQRGLAHQPHAARLHQRYQPLGGRPPMIA